MAEGEVKVEVDAGTARGTKGVADKLTEDEDVGGGAGADEKPKGERNGFRCTGGRGEVALEEERSGAGDWEEGIAEDEGNDPKDEDAPKGCVVPRGDGRGWKEEALPESLDLVAVIAGGGREGAALDSTGEFARRRTA